MELGGTEESGEQMSPLCIASGARVARLYHRLEPSSKKLASQSESSIESLASLEEHTGLLDNTLNEVLSSGNSCRTALLIAEAQIERLEVLRTEGRAALDTFWESTRDLRKSIELCRTGTTGRIAYEETAITSCGRCTSCTTISRVGRQRSIIKTEVEMALDEYTSSSLASLRATFSQAVGLGHVLTNPFDARLSDPTFLPLYSTVLDPVQVCDELRPVEDKQNAAEATREMRARLSERRQRRQRREALGV